MLRMISALVLVVGLAVGQGCEHEVIMPFGVGDLSVNPGGAQMGYLWAGAGPQQALRLQTAYSVGPLIAAPITVTGIAIRGSTSFGTDGSLGASSFANLEIRMATGTAAPNLLDAADLDGNMASDLKVVREAGPLCTPATPPASPVGDWVDLPLTESFSFIPGPGIVLMVEYRSCGGLSQMGVFSGGMGNPIDAAGLGNTTRSLWPLPLGNCAGNAGSSGLGVPVIRLKYQLTAQAPWQENLPESGLRLNGEEPHPYRGPARVRGHVGQWADLDLMTTLVGQPLSLLLTYLPNRDATCGDYFLTNGQQRFHGDFSAGGEILLGECALAAPGPVTTLTIAPPAPLFASLQLAVCDAGHPDGFWLSGPVEYEVDATTPLAMPVAVTLAEGESLEVDVGSIPFYGTNYTKMYVHENGTLTFGCWDHRDLNSPLATAATAGNGVPLVGAWHRFNPAAATFTVESPTPSSFRATFGDVQSGFLPTVTFTIEIDAVTGVIVMDGLSNLAQNSVASLFVGASPGSGPLTVDPMINRPITVGAGVIPGAPQAMTYYQGTPMGLMGLAGLADSVVLTPNGAGYDWQALS